MADKRYTFRGKAVPLFRIGGTPVAEYSMKYTKEQRLDIGRRIYYSEISRYEAAEEYGISEQTARNYMRMYRDANRLPPKRGQRSISALSFKKEPAELDELKSMTKEELIQELIKARITEARLKKDTR